MNLSDELYRLESPDLAVSQRFAQRLRSYMNAARDPELLSDLIDYQLLKRSTHALRVLIALKDIHSQDFFAKLHDALLKTITRIPSLLLLAHMLNGQASWLYKTVDSPIFAPLLQFLRSSNDPVLLSSTLHILCALIPLSPFHISKHLPDLFEGLTHAATLKTVLVKIPKEIFLGLDVAVFYFFLQLYALYPCKLLQYLQSRFGPTGETHIYTEHIAPLFHHVQLHPNLITDLPSLETHRTKWSSKEPYDIGTLALSLCIDPSLIQGGSPFDQDKVAHTPINEQSRDSNEGVSPCIPLLQCDASLCGLLDDTEIWSPLATLGDVTPNSSLPPSRLSNITTPSSESATSSLQTTPLPNLTGEKKFSYSPTASVEGYEVSSCHGNSLEQGRGSEVSPESSGQATPVKSTGNNTPRSFRHIVSDIFRRSTNLATNDDREEFTNISATEIDTILADRDKSFTRSDNVSTKGKTIIDRGMSSSMRVLEPDQGMNFSMRVLDPVRPNGMTVPLPTIISKDFSSVSPQSYPNEHVLLRARERLNSLQLSRSINGGVEIPDYYRNHGNSFLTSYESMSTITSPDEEDVSTTLLIHRTVNVPDETSNHGNGVVGVVSSTLSPVAALDQYILNGNILHVGQLKDVPITDISGIDWNHFGTCPHSEELKIKTGLAAILHSQVLLERHQCQQHARRNRRLMSKARTTTKLENEVLTLRCRLHQQEELITSLTTESSQYIQSLIVKTDETVLAQNKALVTCNMELRNEVQKLRNCVKKRKKENGLFTKRLHNAETIETDNISLRDKLKEVPYLQNQMENVLKEQLVIEELYHQQKVAVAALKRENTQLNQLKQMNVAMGTKNKEITNDVKVLKDKVKRLYTLLKEKDDVIDRKDIQITELKESLESLQQNFINKLEVTESKYHTVTNDNQRLEERILALQSNV